MNIIYIHGLDSQPNLEKIDLIERRGHQTYALHLDYRTDRGCYWKLKEKILTAKIDFIIGSSLGGYFGYWLGQELGIPQLLFNPAMPFRSVQVPSPEVLAEQNTPSWVVLGKHDDTIPANLNNSFFEGREAARVITCAWLGHRIDLTTFEEMICWAGL